MTRSGLLFFVCGVAVALVLGCAPASSLSPKDKEAGPVPEKNAVAVDDALVQFSLLGALAAGDYDGGASLRDVLADGDFGLGTFDRLDGELIVLDGKIYQALADGAVRAADLAGGTPFAAVKFFREDGHVDKLAAPTLDELDAQLDGCLPRLSVPYAIRLDGLFAELTLRSVPAQTPPYQPLVEVVKHQTTTEHRSLRGTLIGVRCPAWVDTLNVSGYHWHFLSDDRGIGGHVLGCKLTEGTARYDQCASLVIRLPRSAAFDAFQKDAVKETDIDRIERQRSQ